jgi:Zn ribbon nucleic-acid-binding protein
MTSGITRICPGCRRSALQVVEGSKGRMGRCVKCGWSGPMRETTKGDHEG